MSDDRIRAFVEGQLSDWSAPFRESKEQRKRFAEGLVEIARRIGEPKLDEFADLCRHGEGWHKNERPDLQWYWRKAYELKPSLRAGLSSTTLYYHCQCGANLSLSTNGACPKCHRNSAVLRESREPRPVIEAHDQCSDCSVYKDGILGAGCSDWGTPGYETCEFRRSCPCVSCCRFAYYQKYRPWELKGEAFAVALRALPEPISAAGRQFKKEAASFVDINAYLEARQRERFDKEKAKKDAEWK